MGRHTSNNSIRKAMIGARIAIERTRRFTGKRKHFWSSWGIIIKKSKKNNNNS